MFSVQDGTDFPHVVQIPPVTERVFVTPAKISPALIAQSAASTSLKSMNLKPRKEVPSVPQYIPSVPFYSQFQDITSPKWKKVGCGVVSLAMLIEYYKPDVVSVDTLLDQGISSGAYLNNAGWTYKGLISLSQAYGLNGNSYDLSALSTKSALAEFSGYLDEGPVIASVHYKFDPKNPIPHLVVINGIKDGVVYYNDPASKSGGGQISTTQFLSAWKKRFIVIRPENEFQKNIVT